MLICICMLWLMPLMLQLSKLKKNISQLKMGKYGCWWIEGWNQSLCSSTVVAIIIRKVGRSFSVPAFFSSFTSRNTSKKMFYSWPRQQKPLQCLWIVSARNVNRSRRLGFALKCDEARPTIQISPQQEADQCRRASSASYDTVVWLILRGHF